MCVSLLRHSRLFKFLTKSTDALTWLEFPPQNSDSRLCGEGIRLTVPLNLISFLKTEKNVKLWFEEDKKPLLSPFPPLLPICLAENGLLLNLGPAEILVSQNFPFRVEAWLHRLWGGRDVSSIMERSKDQSAIRDFFVHWSDHSLDLRPGQDDCYRLGQIKCGKQHGFQNIEI